MAHVTIIDVSCPQQMLALMKWIMEGDRGLLYVRLMRTASAVLYPADYTFELGKGHALKESPDDRAVIVSSGRGVHEALAAAAECAARGVSVGVVDMPSIDADMLLGLCRSGKLVCLAEQNNGYIFQNLVKTAFLHGFSSALGNVMTINTLTRDGRPQFIHSGTYEELVRAFGLASFQLADAIGKRLGEARS
jgi:transketolase C-terminal domain/subunit